MTTIAFIMQKLTQQIPLASKQFISDFGISLFDFGFIPLELERRLGGILNVNRQPAAQRSPSHLLSQQRGNEK